MKKVKRHFSNSRREMNRAVERFAEIDPLEGHRIEAVRLARAVRDQANAAVKELKR